MGCLMVIIKILSGLPGISDPEKTRTQTALSLADFLSKMQGKSIEYLFGVLLALRRCVCYD